MNKYHFTQAQRKEAQSPGKLGPEHEENKAKPKANYFNFMLKLIEAHSRRSKELS